MKKSNDEVMMNWYVLGMESDRPIARIKAPNYSEAEADATSRYGHAILVMDPALYKKHVQTKRALLLKQFPSFSSAVTWLRSCSWQPSTIPEASPYRRRKRKRG